MLAKFDEFLTCRVICETPILEVELILTKLWAWSTEIAVSRILPHFGWQAPAISFSKVGSTAMASLRFIGLHEIVKI